jgi:hypothetical protein
VAVLNRECASLRCLISTIFKPAKVNTEYESLSTKIKADKISSVIDSRNVPDQETPLDLTVHLRDPVATEILMFAAAGWILQNEQGWMALQEEERK